MPIHVYQSGGGGYHRTIETLDKKYRSIIWQKDIFDYLDCEARTMVCWTTLEYPYYADDVSKSMARRRPSIHQAYQTVLSQHDEDYQRGGYLWSSSNGNIIAYHIALIPAFERAGELPDVDWMYDGLINLTGDQGRHYTGGIGIHSPFMSNHAGYELFLNMILDFSSTYNNTVYLYGRGEHAKVMDQPIDNFVRRNNLQLLLPQNTGEKNAI